ncbi:MAG: LytR/AlgR family response regulator transcription factor [Calditrichia bacterium]
MTYRCMIIDDEPLARQLIAEFLEDVDDIKIIASPGNPDEALELILQHKPDVLFLDIQMPGMNGFDLLRQLESPPAVVFCTAYDEYAIAAFEENAIDYLLKPFDKARFNKTLQRLRQQLTDATTTQWQHLIEKLDKNQGGPLERLIVRKGDHLKMVNTAEILWVEAMEDYVKLHTPKEKHLVLRRIGDLADRLPERFLRVHRSTIVNLDAVQEIHPWSSGRFLLKLKDGTEVETSKAGAKSIREMMG